MLLELIDTNKTYLQVQFDVIINLYDVYSPLYKEDQVKVGKKKKSIIKVL